MSNIKKLMILILILILVPMSVYATDKPSSWALEGVNEARVSELAKTEFFNNYKSNITREEMAEIIVRVYEAVTNQKIKMTDNKFIDTDNPEVIKASRLGFVRGVTDNQYYPKNNLTREEMSVIFGNLLQFISRELPEVQILKTFIDEKNISNWALEDVNSMYIGGVLSGFENDRIGPKDNLTREQALLVVNRFFKILYADEDLRYEYKEEIFEIADDVFDNLSDFEHPLTEDEIELARLVNEYRVSLGLKAFPISKSLTKVARIHATDTQKNKAYEELDRRGIQGNLHSWSDKGPWRRVIYTGDHYHSAEIWKKPSELSNYKGNGFEISIITGNTKITPLQALAGWKTSPEHNEVIISRGPWRDLKTMGIGIRYGVSHIWFGKEADPDGYFYIN